MPAAFRAFERVQLTINTGACDTAQKIAPGRRVIFQAIVNETDIMRFRAEREGIGCRTSESSGTDSLCAWATAVTILVAPPPAETRQTAGFLVARA
jgi:hypothetical protein